MKVIVTGSRDHSDRALVWSVLDGLLAERRGLILVHGACPTGADRHADDWAKSNSGTAGAVKLARRARIEVREYGRPEPAEPADALF
jgi:hypothetical protein